MTFVIPLRALGRRDVPRVGGKAANLGILLSALAGAGVRVPDGFAITADAFRAHLDAAGLTGAIAAELDALDLDDVHALAEVAGAIRARVRAAPLPAEVAAEVTAAYDALVHDAGAADAGVAVRSSSTAEDLPAASFAGQYDTCLNVRGHAALLDAVRACMASLYTDRAIVYRRARGFADGDVALAVCVQHMVRSDLGAAGVMYTLDPSSGLRDVIEISAAWGLGVAVVQGRVEPDSFVVHKPTLAAGYPAIVDRAVGDKPIRIAYADGGGITEVATAAAERRRPAITDDDALALARWGLAIETHYGRPMDIEWAKDGPTGALYVVQARPETGHATRARARQAFGVFRRTGAGEVVVSGKSVGTTIAHGHARVVGDAASRDAFQAGEVIVAARSDPAWEPLLARAAAVVLEHGGRTSHVAMVARELGVPCVVDAHDATRVIRTGDEVTVSCAEGVIGRVLAGRVPYVRDAIDVAILPAPPLPVTLDLGEPGDAFALARLPAAGVGRLRTELAIAAVGVHPMALVHPDRVSDPHERAELAERVAGLDTPGELLIGRLTAAIARVAAAFYPRPVIVRFSDFKSHEYAGLLGGRDFEPLHEANPMLGFRGAARYHDERYRAGFALECAAIRRARDQLGLRNVAVMVPFARTVDDARRVLDVMADAGLRRGDAGLEVHLVCEIPNAVMLATELAGLCDGFTIDADLAQLVLGVDRDSALVADLVDETDPGVRAMIASLIEAAHARGRPVGYCGRGAAEDPAYARELAALGIDSIAVTPDAWPRVVDHLARSAPRPRRRRRMLDRIRALRRARRG